LATLRVRWQALRIGLRSSLQTAYAAPIDSHLYPDPIHIPSWIAEHSASMVPPVGNKLMYSNDCDVRPVCCSLPHPRELTLIAPKLKIMMIAGPNNRTDFHIDLGEEWFVMLKGDMNLWVRTRSCNKPSVH
jgi:hypothetical protein